MMNDMIKMNEYDVIVVNECLGPLNAKVQGMVQKLSNTDVGGSEKMWAKIALGEQHPGRI